MLADTATLADLGLASADALTELCERYDVRQLDIYGSAARQHDFAASSDIDLLVEFMPSANKALMELEQSEILWNMEQVKVRAGDVTEW